MSFFDDFVNEVNVGDDSFNIKIVLNKYVYLCGKFKVIDFYEELILILIDNKKYKILGSNLNIKSLAKNEMFVQGNVVGFVEE